MKVAKTENLSNHKRQHSFVAVQKQKYTSWNQMWNLGCSYTDQKRQCFCRLMWEAEEVMHTWNGEVRVLLWTWSLLRGSLLYLCMGTSSDTSTEIHPISKHTVGLVSLLSTAISSSVAFFHLSNWKPHTSSLSSVYLIVEPDMPSPFHP